MLDYFETAKGLWKKCKIWLIGITLPLISKVGYLLLHWHTFMAVSQNDNPVSQKWQYF